MESKIPKILSVKALPEFRIRVLFSDGVSGDVDLHDLCGKGIFRELKNDNLFEKVYIDQDSGSIAWSEVLEIDPFTIYLGLIGKTFDEWSQKQQNAAA